VIHERAWNEYIAVHPVLFHVTPEGNVPSILERGLIPGSRLGVSVRDDFFRTRAGRTYLIKQADIPIVDVFDEPRVLAIDLAQLDPARVDPDEDCVKDRFPEVVDVPAPIRECDAANNELPGQAGRLALWADAIPDFDRSEVTERSLKEAGRMSYRGVIPTSAITLVHVPSEAVGRFVGALRLDSAAVRPHVPHQSTWKAEVRRACLIAEVVATELCAALGHNGVRVSLADPYRMRAAPGDLRNVAIALYSKGVSEPGDAASAMMRALEVADRFDGYAAVSDVTTSGELEAACAGALNSLANVPGVPQADVARIARHAAETAASVTYAGEREQ